VASGMYMRTLHSGQFKLYMAHTPEQGKYGLFLRSKKHKLQIGGPNYYNNGGTQFNMDRLVY